MKVEPTPTLGLTFGWVGLAVVMTAGCGSSQASGYSQGSGGITGTGAVGTAGLPGTGGTSAPTCSPACALDSTCCNGSSESCDGTELPTGDGTDSGEFVVGADGLTLTDAITGVVWQRDGSGSRPNCANSPRCTWAEAKAYCGALTLGSVSGWRLPTRMELMTTVNTTMSAPAIDETAFPNTPAEIFWTSSPHTESGFAWNINFSDGSSNSYSTGSSGRVRCVRGSRCYPSSRFVVLSGGRVQDTLTSLVWQQDGSGTRGCGAGAACSWDEAEAYCAKLSLGDQTGWRLPTLKELLSIVDLTVTAGATINPTAFPNTPTYFFWTSSPCAGHPEDAWIVNFGDGSSSGYWVYQVITAQRVRCVR